MSIANHVTVPEVQDGFHMTDHRPAVVPGPDTVMMNPVLAEDALQVMTVPDLHLSAVVLVHLSDDKVRKTLL